mmetsp:Transcript_38921/g.38524  ORF Transcript_38921/g.38524 Transcript_38921/m.38524 type:complete len:93 (-) Transcript_38921:19-297(-)
MIENLTLEGYEWSAENNDVVASDVLSAKLPVSSIKWVHKDQSTKEELLQRLPIPVYLNSERLDLLFSVKIASNQPRADLYQRGIALTAWSIS